MYRRSILLAGILVTIALPSFAGSNADKILVAQYSRSNKTIDYSEHIERYKKRRAQDKKQRQRATQARQRSFNAATAPAPDQCLLKFLHVARGASSMVQLLPYLPKADAELLRSKHARHDPKKEQEKRAWWKKKSPKISEHDLARYCGDPYKVELLKAKELANTVAKVGSSKVSGDTAKVIVIRRCNEVIRSKRMSRKQSRVKMKGEGNYWKYAGYSDTGAYFK